MQTVPVPSLNYLRIVSTGQKMGWLQARKEVRKLGKTSLPSNVLHDGLMVRPDVSLPLVLWTKKGTTEWDKEKHDIIEQVNTIRGAAREYYPLWTCEVLAYPEPDGVFKRGQDVVSTMPDGNGYTWFLPASCIPSEAFRIRNVGLFFTPDNVAVDKDRKRVEIFVLEDDRIVLNNLAQDVQVHLENSGGKADTRTSMPIAVGPRDWNQLHYLNKRWLCRNQWQSVVPIARDIGHHAPGPQYIIARDAASGYNLAYVEQVTPVYG
jgi:hypothetical protein